MPVGSVGKWLVLGTLVATLGAGGCKEDDGGDEPVKDAGGTTDAGGGGTDSGSPTDAGTKDSGSTDAGTDAGLSCGGQMCTGHTTGLGPVAPGCAKNYQDAEVCGLSSQTILMGMEPKFIEKNAPGVPSQPCADFYDTREMPSQDAGTDAGTKGNGKIDTTLMAAGLNIMLQYPGCCTKAGFCSGQGMLGKSSINGGASWMDSDNGYGCMQSEIFFRSLPVEAQKIPCDPVSGELKLPAGDGGVDGGASDGGASDGGASDAGADGGNG